MVTAAHTRFLIFDRARNDVAGLCSGPDAAGRCPLAADGEPAPCAGRDLVLLADNHATRWSLSVSAVEDECPLPIMCAGGG